MVLGMAEQQYQDPSANTAQFQAFAQRTEPACGRCAIVVGKGEEFSMGTGNAVISRHRRAFVFFS